MDMLLLLSFSFFSVLPMSFRWSIRHRYLFFSYLSLYIKFTYVLSKRFYSDVCCPSISISRSFSFQTTFRFSHSFYRYVGVYLLNIFKNEQFVLGQLEHFSREYWCNGPVLFPILPLKSGFDSLFSCYLLQINTTMVQHTRRKRIRNL
jgi:hypothetical protein